MLALHSIGGAAISAHPSLHYNNGESVVRCEVRYEAVPYSAYRAFVTDESIMKVYSVEIPMRPLTDRIET